ncbi:MAG: tyrosine-type recombinase/integrase [Gemmiger sp.]|nr:tyrosine-type recombinase/integrase [Gemmiger sp.]MDY5784069.1 tyrosine-type recombinase/integrase [Gemmiger sp.]
MFSFPFAVPSCHARRPHYHRFCCGKAWNIATSRNLPGCRTDSFCQSLHSYGSIVDRVAKKAGIRKIHPHMFRHTFVSILLSNPDIGVATVAAEAGHAQPSTTLAICT